MNIVAAFGGAYEIEVPPGTTAAELIRTLHTLPTDAALIEHFGDVDLVAVFRARPTESIPQS
jgi:uncharacterized repeat protein (TIGR03917 family)